MSILWQNINYNTWRISTYAGRLMLVIGSLKFGAGKAKLILANQDAIEKHSHLANEYHEEPDEYGRHHLSNPLVLQNQYTKYEIAPSECRQVIRYWQVIEMFISDELIGWGNWPEFSGYVADQTARHLCYNAGDWWDLKSLVADIKATLDQYTESDLCHFRKIYRMKSKLWGGENACALWFKNQPKGVHYPENPKPFSNKLMSEWRFDSYSKYIAIKEGNLSPEQAKKEELNETIKNIDRYLQESGYVPKPGYLTKGAEYV